ncbi:hypothetical protein, partial [Escherichia coli]|uniref:hypothetical protein n=1 Tax=Escherichia coli TaxID=562 RepID=UPI0032D9F8A0
NPFKPAASKLHGRRLHQICCCRQGAASLDLHRHPPQLLLAEGGLSLSCPVTRVDMSSRSCIAREKW